MAKSSKRPTTWQEALELMTRCPVCGTALKTPTAKICAKDEHASKVHLTCRQCGNYALIVIVLMNQGVSSVGMVTDLSFHDVKRLSSLPPIEIDDLINAYEFLQNNDVLDYDHYSLGHNSKN